MNDNDNPRLMSEESYDPNGLMDALIVKLDLKQDAALARALEVSPRVISKIRNKTLPVGAPMLIRMHEESGLAIHERRDLMGDRRKKFRVSTTHFKLAQ